MSGVEKEWAGEPGTLRIAVVGAGAVGSYYGGILAYAGEDVHFLLRSDYEAVCEQGMRIIRHGRDEFTIQPQVYNDSAKMGTFDVVIIAAKTTANDALVEVVRPLVGEGTVILTLQNGMGNAEHWAKLAGGLERVMAGLCFVCINRTGPGIIENFMPGSITLAKGVGAPQERTRDFAARLLRAGSPMRLADNLEEALWKKLVWNVPFNGLTIAAGGIDCGTVLASEALTSEVNALMREVQAAAAAYGHIIHDHFLAKQLEVTYPMKDYKPSSLIDYLDDKPVEVEAIWGVPLERAKAKGVAVPKMEMLHALLEQVTV